VQAISLRSAISREETKQKADEGNPHCAFTPFSFDLQGLDGLGGQF
jgi:hypothetical protein